METAEIAIETADQNQKITLKDIREAALSKMFVSNDGQLLTEKQKENIRFLIGRIENTGFLRMVTDGQGQQKDLYQSVLAAVLKGDKKFKLDMQSGEAKLEGRAVLHFNFHEPSGYYYWNSYTMSIKHPLAEGRIGKKFQVKNESNRDIKPVPGSGKDYVKNRNITSMESQHLLLGRSVCKEERGANDVAKEQWVTLDYKNGAPKSYADIIVMDPEEGYNFNLNDTLKQLPIKDLEQLLIDNKFTDSLKRGNVRDVILIINGQERKFGIAVDALNKSISFINSKTGLQIEKDDYFTLMGELLADKYQDVLSPEEGKMLAKGSSICQLRQNDNGESREMWLTLNSAGENPWIANDLIASDPIEGYKFKPLEELYQLPIADKTKIPEYMEMFKAGRSQWVEMLVENKPFAIQMQVNAIAGEFKMYLPSGRELNQDEVYKLVNHSKAKTVVESNIQDIAQANVKESNESFKPGTGRKPGKEAEEKKEKKNQQTASTASTTVRTGRRRKTVS